MRHLKDEDIFNYRTGSLGGIKKLLVEAHLKGCPSCREKIEAEERLAKAFQARVNANLSRFEPSQMMDARVRRAIDTIAPTMPGPLVWVLRRVMTTGLVVALVASVYSVFFYAPLFGSAKETPAQAVVSGMMTPVISKAKTLIPQSLYSNSQTIDKFIFLNIWCNSYNICEADRLRLIHLEGHNYPDVFIASLLGQLYSKPVDQILPMIEKGLTPGQIVSELNVPFTSQVTLVGQASNMVEQTKTDIESKKSVEVSIKKVNGQIISPVKLSEEATKELLAKKDGVYDTDITRDNKVEKVTPVPSGYGFYSGSVISVDTDRDIFKVKTDKGEITVKIAGETSLVRYGDSILPSQLYKGQNVQISATKVGDAFVATLVDVTEPDSTIETSGEIAAFENNSLAIRGFGAELIITASSVVKGTIEHGSLARITAIGNDIQGYRVKTITITKPYVKPVREKLETVEGIVVAIETDDGGRRFILLSDGTMIGYSRDTKFQGEPLSIGMKVSSLGVMSGEHNQDARVMNVTETAQAEGFEVSGEFDSMICLNNCSWVEAKGVSQVMLKGSGIQYIIYPKTVNHLKLNMAKKGQTVIFEGRVIEGLKLVDRIDVVEPQTQFIHKGQVVTVKNGLITLDDQTEIKIKSYTKSGKDAVVGATVSISCYRSDNGLIALEVNAQLEKAAIATGWTKIASFDGTTLSLEDGTKVEVTDSTEIVTGLLSEKVDKSALLPGLKVTCTYIPGTTNKAVKIMIFEGQ